LVAHAAALFGGIVTEVEHADPAGGVS